MAFRVFDNPIDEVYVAQTLCSILIQNCPKDHLNLVDTIGFWVAANGEWQVFIGGDALLAYAKAPYAGFTNEPRSDGKVMHYRKVYPGQVLTGWIDKSIEQCIKVIEAGW